MAKFIRRIIISILVIILVAEYFFYFRHQVYYSQGSYPGEKIIEITEGEKTTQIAQRLEDEGFISQKIYFYYYLKTTGLTSGIMPGEYQLSGTMTIPEIISVITNVKKKFVRVTFPEGFTMKQMAERLNANDLPGDDFLQIAENPNEMQNRYSYLQDDSIKTLEGYLFPDTYFFKQDAEAKDIIGRMLDTFDQKFDAEMREKIATDGKNISDVIVMASMVEKEVQTPEDMKIAAGIFWNRLAIGQRLQSDAPLSYILDDNIDSHGAADLAYDSPYNTYRYAGLPPGPICNPGKNALLAAIYPTESPYNYFLTATVNGEKKVVYSKTFEEHVANKRKYGL